MVLEQFPNMVDMSNPEEINATYFGEVLCRRVFSAIVVVGRAPYQGYSSLNKFCEGLPDPRGLQP